MKSTTCLLAAALAAVVPLSSRADETPAHVRVADLPAGAHAPAVYRLVADEAKPIPPAPMERRMRRLDRPPAEMEPVTFLGVEAVPASATLVAQLNLPNGAGLVVARVVPGSPAAGVLKQHDVLLKLDDQILIDQHQLSVLVRGHKEGEEVTLTYIRAGKSDTARLKLAKRDMPKEVGLTAPAAPFGPGGFGNAFTLTDDNPEHLDRVLSLLNRAHRAAGDRMEIKDDDQRGIHAMSISTGNSNLVYSDDAGSLELALKDGEKTLLAKDPKGDVVFKGPVTTEEQRKLMPGDVRNRLEKLESMQDVTFRTDGGFEGLRTRVLTPRGEAIALPHYEPGASHPLTL